MADSLDLGVKPDANKYERAAVYVRDAMHGRTTMAHDKWSFFYHRIYINLIYVNVYRLMSVALLALAFWEGPSKHAPDALADAELRWVYYSLEVFFLLFFCFDSYLQFKDFGKARFMRKRWVRIKLACVALFLLDLVVSIIIPNNYLRLVRALWPVFFIERNENVRKIVGSLLHAVPKILNVVVLVLVHITLFGVFAYVFFAGIDDDNCEAWVPTQVSSERCSTYITEGCSNYFQTLGQSIMQLFILGTTANFPEVMMPAYRCNHWAGWFFVVFLVIGLYFLVNLTIAVTYTTFQELSKGKILKKHNRVLKGLSLAYSELTKGTQASVRKASRRKRQQAAAMGTSTRSKFAKLAVDFLLRDDWVCFMNTLRPDLPTEISRKLFDIMDVDHEGMIVEQEFNQLVYHFYKLKAVPRIVASSPASGGSPASTAAAGSRRRIEALSIDVGTQPKPATRQRPWTRQRMEVWLRSTRCNAIFDAFVVLNSALICLYLGLEKDQDLGTVTSFQQVVQAGLYFTFGVFVVEVVAKMVVFGPWPYFLGVYPGVETSVDILNPLAQPQQPLLPSPSSKATGDDTNGATKDARKRSATTVPASTSHDLRRRAVSGASPVERKRAESTGSVASANSAATELTLFPLFLDGQDKADESLWNVDPVFNKVDLAVLCGSVVAFALSAAGVASDQAVIAVTIFRMLRIFRALRSIQGFTVTVYSFVQIIPLMARYFAVLFCVLFSFAVVGMELFSGRLTQADPAVMASAYGVNRYWVNNFDTLQSSIMVLFEQLVVNNWPIVMEGCVAATTLWARVYFIFFYGFSVVAVLSVLLAFLLESFAVKREHNTKILSVRLMRKQQGDAAAEDLQKQELDEAWTHLLRYSGQDFSKWTLSKFSSHSDIYDMIFKDAIQRTHHFTTAMRSADRTVLFDHASVSQFPSMRAASSKRSYHRGGSRS